MNDSNIFLILIIYFIVYLLFVFHRGKLEFAKFLLGSVSLFILLFFSLQKTLTPILARLVAQTCGYIGELTNTFTAYAKYGILFINNNGETISLYIDYECAGFIEMTIFVSLVIFFPLFNIFKKLYITIFGVISIFLSNVIRLLTICFIVYFFGNESFYIAHTIIGRLIFYTLSIVLYYYIFTKSQIIHQKVGSFKYVKDTNK